MMTRLWSVLRSALRPRGTAAFLGLAVIVGVTVGLAAAAFIGAIEGVKWLAEWLSGQIGTVGVLGAEIGGIKLVVLVALPFGLFVAWAMGRRYPEVNADGVPEVMAAVAIRSGYMPTRGVPLKLAAGSLVIGLGGSVGREGPIAQIGGTIGSSLARHTGLGEDQVRSLVAAGAGAAIAASFNAPIAGMLFAIEVILGNFAIRHLNAVVVASVTAAVTTSSIVGEERILSAYPHKLNHPSELLLYAALGALAVVVGWLFLRCLATGEAVRHKGPPWLRPVLFGLVVAGIGFVEPDILGTGQNVVASFLDLTTGTSVVWWSVLALVGYKIAATSLTLGVGGYGGVFMPSLFIGAALGAGFAALVAPVWHGPQLEPGAFAIVGMAAMFSAVARAPLTSILIVFEVTGDYGLVLPLMLAASLATFAGDRVHRDSVYAMSLARRGIRLRRHSEIDLLDTVRIGDVASAVDASVSTDMTTAQVQGLFDRTRQRSMPVVESEKLVGVITTTDILRTGGPSDLVSAGDAMTPRPTTLVPSSAVSEALERMASLGVGIIPVVAEDNPRRLVGVFRRGDAVAAYHLALGQEVHHEMGRERLRARTHPEASFSDIEIPPGSVADGRRVREVPIPQGCTIVSVRRGAEIRVPHGHTVLEAGDVLTIFSRRAARDQLADRLRADEWTGEHERVEREPEARFFDVEIPVGSVADGRAVKEIPIPHGCTIVSVRRDGETLVPDGGTELRGGDIIVLFALPASREQLVERLRASAEEG